MHWQLVHRADVCGEFFYSRKLRRWFAFEMGKSDVGSGAKDVLTGGCSYGDAHLFREQMRIS